MPTFNVAGIDVGFRKTGIAVFTMTPDKDDLIAATTIFPDEPGKSVLYKDIHSCQAMLKGTAQFLKDHAVKALFLEFPSGGSQSGRASRCMGMATGIAVALLNDYEWECGFEVYTPDKIETLLGIKAKPGSKTKLSKGGKRAEKKDALKQIVLKQYDDEKFSGWPATKALAEDAYDAAAAFMAARLESGEGLYHRLRWICEGISKQKVGD